MNNCILICDMRKPSDCCKLYKSENEPSNPCHHTVHEPILFVPVSWLKSQWLIIFLFAIIIKSHILFPLSCMINHMGSLIVFRPNYCEFFVQLKLVILCFISLKRSWDIHFLIAFSLCATFQIILVLCWLWRFMSSTPSVLDNATRWCCSKQHHVCICHILTKSYAKIRIISKLKLLKKIVKNSLINDKNFFGFAAF